MLDRKKIKNLHIQETSKRDEKVNLIVETYLYELHKNIQEKKYDKNLCPDYLKVICEVYELLEDKAIWLEDIYILLTEFKRDILDKKIYINLSLFGGLCDMSYTMHYLCKKTKHFHKLQLSLQNIIIDGCKKLLREVTVYNSGASAYDVIQGLSGILEYMLECLDVQENIKIIQSVLDHLVSIVAENHRYRTWNVPNFHISQENQFRDDEKALYKEGNINLGVAHGIIGILAVLVKAKNLGIKNKKLNYSIDRILQIYTKFGKKSEYGYLTWPEQISTENFLYNQNYNFRNDRQSWCYGSLGISSVLYHVARELKQRKLQVSMSENIVAIAQQDIEKYQLLSPIICHGYAGAMLMFLNLYKLEKNEDIHNRIVTLLDYILQCYDSESKYGFKDKYIKWEEDGQRVEEKDKDSFLEGASGIILTLISLKKTETMFDKVLLIK